ncbi:CDP-glucose 4,6-dehydratase [Niveibacterium sp. COAC-50]|uniref:CDP-glucose 4,6-dehydratase n=1 Tax=Niveibacterium sp. COAC-50 TaxID=2729384 RepID=UPI001553B699|nr:CDP-glucose 4,6-dehydratase [Niveibacterium sp. COAC-50]
MKQLLNFERRLQGRKILVTGNTGFTGSWVCHWLALIGADCCGFSLPADTQPAMFEVTGLSGCVNTVYGDVRDFDAVLDAMQEIKPEVVLHLAAQPLVRRSYREPLETFAVNAQGTAHVLEAARRTGVKAVVCVTTDKVYRNNEWDWPYRENDPLGGKDPYSASKAAAEMMIQSYMASYPWADDKGPAVAIARGGNIIGGGDWSEDRLIPDFVRAVVQGGALTLRYPDATRPWQHVLALVQGYLMLLAGLLDTPQRYARAWNLGPQDPKQYSVRDLLELMAGHWERPELKYMDSPLPEARSLALDSTIARNLMGWEPAWNSAEVALRCAEWYRDYYAAPESGRAITLQQINAWRTALLDRKIA